MFRENLYRLIALMFSISRSVWHPNVHPFRNNARINTGRFPLEATLKILCTLGGMLGELITGFENGQFTHIHNAQHMTMFGFFCFNGLVDLAYHYQVPALPKNLDYLSAVMALAIEGVLFMWHLHGRPPMDVQVHTFLTYVIGVTILAIAVEMWRPRDPRPAMIRSWFLIIQGTWFWQVGQILYPKFGGQPWKEDDHTQMLIVTMIFTWHIAVDLIIVVLIGLFCYWMARRRYGKLTPEKLAKNGSKMGNGGVYKRLNLSEQENQLELAILSDDEDEDI